MDSGTFQFIPGPVFANCVLADEINRTSPRVQSALLESMNEGQVTLDGETRPLPQPFLVIATQNDTYATGTFPLPEPQLDRFLLSIAMHLPDPATQRRILLAHANREIPNVNGGPPLLSPAEILNLQSAAESLPVSAAIAEYVTDLSQCLRRLAGGEHTVSVRASLAIIQAARAHAFLDDAPAVYPDHIQAVFAAVMRHRVLPHDGADPAFIVRTALEQTPVV
jgi:MoxR-like ATPase